MEERGGGGGGGGRHLTVPLFKVEDSEGWLHVSDSAYDFKLDIEGACAALPERVW